MAIPDHIKNNPNLPLELVPEVLVAEPTLPHLDTTAKAQAALDDIDQDAIYDEERGHWTVEEWDKTSPINGASAESMIARHGVGDSPVYLLRQDGQVVYFQTHKPHVEGFAKIEDASAEGAQHADEIAAHRTVTSIIAQLRNAE